ncbi:MAG: hypothetical protein I8H77_15765 [Comamonadaceae bacterium]|nr:hypothetical protein [Comamonadaceae bacterium]
MARAIHSGKISAEPVKTWVSLGMDLAGVLGGIERSAARFSVGLAALVLAGCAPVQTATMNDNLQLIARAKQGHVRDLRGEYRQALCSRLTGQSACEDVLLRFPGESVARHHVVSNAASLAARYRIAFVPGLFSDCAEKRFVPFADVADELSAAGFEINLLRVQGRAGTEQNAAQLAGEIAKLPHDGKRLIVFAYSKGLPDVFDLLVRHPPVRQRVAAVVSYAGAVHGSPLADELRGIYDAFVTRLPIGGCAVGNGAELEALRPGVRHAWWAAHHRELRDTRVPFFSLVGAPLPERVSPLLRLNHSRLAERDVHNDSQLLADDAVVPGSALLGYINADHWVMAIPLAKQLPALAALFHDDVPRGALVGAAIEVVDSALRTTPRSLSPP